MLGIQSLTQLAAGQSFHATAKHLRATHLGTATLRRHDLHLLQTQELHIEQAIKLCSDPLKSDATEADKALALCWIGHLVGDAHQPCHAGSLYFSAFPEGDRGANWIQTTHSRNMHALWDQLLGRQFNNGDVKRRALEISNDDALLQMLDAAKQQPDFLTTEKWLSEAAQHLVMMGD